jgi:intraflagellar transport protein 46
LQVSNDVKELFEYITRYKPQKIDLETKLKPFIPDFVPAVGEVDAFLKMPKPDGTKEDLGIT